ncbi:MAG: FeoA family protein [Anaerolineaceae bacterium]
MKRDSIYLINAPVGMELQIVSFENGELFNHKLNRIGLFPGDIVKILRIAPLRGPLLLESAGREIALGREIAARIRVEQIA